MTGRVGLAHAWHQVDTTRTVAIPGLTNTLEASFDADTRQYFAEIGYAARFGGLTLEPFAGYRHVSVEHDGFAEAGGASALNASAGDQDVQFLTVGARLAGSGEVGPGLRVEPTARLAWQRAWGDRQSESSLAFASGGRFAIQGLEVDRDSLEIDAGLTLRAGRFSVGASYSGSIGEDFTSHGGRVSVGIRF
jgi:outer membrane autotransporter protein